MADARAPEPVWRVWIDTGGTFTDCLARSPEGELRRAKVLSHGALRARFERAVGPRSLAYTAPWETPERFFDGAALRWLERGGGATVAGCGAGRIELDRPLPGDLRRGEVLELATGEEAPILAARLVTGAAAGEPLPAVEMRLATTRGTNALLERRGAPPALFITRGLGDLLTIGDQRRGDLFALDIRRPRPLYKAVVEVPERLAADGSVLLPLDVEALRSRAEELLAVGCESAAVALLHSYRNPEPERRLAAFLRSLGFRRVAASAELAPLVKILPRAETAVVEAYLAAILGRYLARVEAAVRRGRLHVMTSAGGLVRAADFRAKDSLLSGPAGGVVGAVQVGRECGLSRLIAFDMGGTSTDVSRYDGRYEYLFEHRVGDATLVAPALAIESVAAGGGSVCSFADGRLKVGPESAGADPGPACYGAGGPLTLTDVNLLLGRLDPERFGIPVAPQRSAEAFERLQAALAAAGGSPPGDLAVLEGLLQIADERMADAIRTISVRRGYDPRDHALVAFGGAGGQHACAVAELLGISTVVLPRDAGLLSALGLGAAVVERFAQRQLSAPLAEVAGRLSAALDALEEEARLAVAAEGVAAEEVEVRRRIVALRWAGQESSLEVEAGQADLAAAFRRRYQEVYGYRPPERPIEVEALRVVASSRAPEVAVAAAAAPWPAAPDGRRRVAFRGRWRQVPVYLRRRLADGARLGGPALVFEEHAALVLPPAWQALRGGHGHLVLTRTAARR